MTKDAPFPGYGIFYSQRYDFKNPYNQSWNLSIQRQVANGWLVTASYLGSNTMHLWGNKHEQYPNVNRGEAPLVNSPTGATPPPLPPF